MFDANQLLNLTTARGWVYKAGHQPDWANPALNTVGWIQRNPSTFSAEDADASGRAEGWFRLNIRLDPLLKNWPLTLQKSSWAAVDVYLDGRLLHSFGSTGAGGLPYAEHTLADEFPTAIQVDYQQQQVLAIHVVDYTAPLPFSRNKLKSEFDFGSYQLIELGGPQATITIKDELKARYMLTTVWVTLALILTGLSWLLPFQNSDEKKILRLLAIWGSLASLHNLGLFAQAFQLPFAVAYTAFNLAWGIYYILGGLLVVVLFPILGRPLSSRSNWIIIVFSVIEGGWSVYSGSNMLGSITNVCLFFLILYVLIASWKKLKGAQWAIVVGAVLSLFFNLTFAIAALSYFFHSNSTILKVMGLDAQSSLTGTLLSLPLAFITYILLRFREILQEVGQKAAAVIRITEEKRQLLADQNGRLEQQVEQRTAELRVSQAQLIQKEKLASLGELTAGIAHEIQNPLNFVNNFSEVSTELVNELEEEHSRPQRDIELEAELLNDLKQNLQKITQHGSRASGIVRGMLEHSRSTTGERELTDLNALCDEYLRLAYHGQRAKDKDFSCEFITQFALTVGKVELTTQEIGRVLLNLFNNAFYAVRERSKQAVTGYEPKVTVTTLRTNQGVEVRVGDNGTGIPPNVQQKIFQPFFTTKPTGEGTGLGLSLSYDIITKGYGGRLSVESKGDEGATFVIELPHL